MNLQNYARLRPFIAGIIVAFLIVYAVIIVKPSKSVVELLFLCAFVCVALVWFFWQDRLAHQHLEKWARQNGFRLVSAKLSWSLLGPFWWRKSKAQRVYCVDVLDAEGNHRTGVARVGGWLLGLFDDKVVVEWNRPDALYGPKGFPAIVKDVKDEGRFG